MKFLSLSLLVLVTSFGGVAHAEKYADIQGRVLSVNCGHFDEYNVGNACVIDLQLQRSHGFSTSQFVVWKDAARVAKVQYRLPGAYLTIPRTDLRSIDDLSIIAVIHAPGTSEGVYELVSVDRVNVR